MNIPSLETIHTVRAEFQKIGCAQLKDSSPDFVLPLPLDLKARSSKRHLAGPIFPIVTGNDMLPCIQALDAAPAGFVLFIHQTEPPTCAEALVGDIFVAAASSQGLGGIIVNGAVRDVDFFDQFSLPVFSRSVTFISSKRAQQLAKEVPAQLSISGHDLCAGDWVFADSDGIVLIKETLLSAVFNAALVLRAVEEDLKQAIRSGRRFGEIVGLADYVAGRGQLKFKI